MVAGINLKESRRETKKRGLGENRLEFNRVNVKTTFCSTSRHLPYFEVAKTRIKNNIK
jgi:hypothetical protein